MEVPERHLWQEVLLQAMRDAVNPFPTDYIDRIEQRTADAWFRTGGRDFRDVCELAGFDHEFIRDAYIGGRILPVNIYNVRKLALIETYREAAQDHERSRKEKEETRVAYANVLGQRRRRPGKQG